MHNIIPTLLLLAAVYSGVMWIWLAVVSVTRRKSLSFEALVEFERQTFHLGLCFILAAGFAGLMLEAC